MVPRIALGLPGRLLLLLSMAGLLVWTGREGPAPMCAAEPEDPPPLSPSTDRGSAATPAEHASHSTREAVDESCGWPQRIGPAIPLDGNDFGEPLVEVWQSMRTAEIVTYLPAQGDELGWFRFELRGLPRADLPQAATLSSQTGWGITWLNGPQTMDLPPQLYHFTLDVGGLSELGESWIWDVAVTPGWFTDGENRRPEAFRLMGRAAAYYRLDETRQLGLGMVYLNRDDIPALPVAGMIWQSEEAGFRHELIFPRPRLSWRWKETLSASRWGYVGAELGGGSWAIKRADRTPDVVTLRDYRLLGGVEFHRHGGLWAAIEAGLVFGRSVESRTGQGDYAPPATGLLRLWFQY